MTVEECYDRIGGDYADMLSRFKTCEKIERFLGMFLRDDNFEKLRSAVEQKNPTDAFRAAHTLKGVYLNFSFIKPLVKCQRAAELLRGGEWSDDVLPLFDEMKEDYGRITEGISELLEAGKE